ncbi:radical SAM protein [bacterium]|nr:radical SAM protein [bacterium]
MILIHPPAAKPGEPPAGIARLSGALKSAGVEHEVIDAGLESLLYRLGRSGTAAAPGGRRVSVPDHLAALRSGAGYRSIDHYRRIVGDLNRILAAACGGKTARWDMAEYRHERFSPTDSLSLCGAAEHPELLPFYSYYRESLMPRLKRHDPRIIGISLNFLSQAPGAFALAGMIRRELPGVRILMGGGLITSWMCRYPLPALFRGLVDSFTAGPGEEDVLREAGAEAQAEDAVPDYTGFPTADYLSPVPVLPYAASDGCYWRRCAFCPEKTEDARYRARAAETVIDQVTNGSAAVHAGLIHFLDAAMPPVILAALSRTRPPAPWYGYARFEEHLLDFDRCRALKLNGCRMLKLGLESGSQRVLDAMQKGIDLERASAILENLRRAGIPTYVYVLFGTPSEREEDAGMTMDFITRHADAVTFLNAAIFNLPAESDEAAGLETFPLSRDDLSLYCGFHHPHGWDRGKIRHFLDRVWKRDPVIRAILNRTPTTFTSNHAPFFVR